MTQAADVVAVKAPVRPNSVEHWAIATPDRVAITDGTRTLTWKQLDEASNRLAEALAQRGVKAGDIIGVRTQIRLDWAVISQALAKLDCSLLGLNWRLTPVEVAFCVSNSGACGLICDDAEPAPLLEPLRDLPIKLVSSLDAEAAGFVAYADLLAAPAVVRNSTREAPMVLYTSGTTGFPKGVASRPPPAAPEELKLLMEYVASMREADARYPDDVVLVTMPFSHGAGPALVRGAVSVGAQMVFMRRFDPEAALELIQQHRVTVWTSVPTMLKRLAALPPEVFSRYNISSVRQLGTGAAPVPLSIKQWVRERFGPILHEGYGATEVGMISHLTPEQEMQKPGSSGRPYRHVSISIRDENDVQLPPNQPGEIWVRTPATITSYLNAPPLDAATRDAEGYFRTGDVGYLDEDGFVFITDRAKDMIISGGVNIYPAEIEAVLIRHSAVQDVAVIGVPDDEFGESVKAFVEVRPGCSLLAEELIAFAQGALASYKRPKSVEIVDELPRNTMGKLLKKDLRESYWEGRERKV
jgi:long-chain acyl-CoA synthetase